MKILHITSITNPKGNGVAAAVENYFKYEKKIVEVAIYNIEKDIVHDDMSFNYTNYKTISSLPKGFNKPDLVIFNELYKIKYISLYKECLKNNIKYIIIPHGCLVKESQNKHKIKKIIANILLFNNFIKKSFAIQFLNENEKNKSKFNRHKSIISGNGIRKPTYINEFNDNFKNIVYIGRYEINCKGLDLIVNVCEKYKSWFINNKVKILLYGRDSGDDLKDLKKMVRDKNVDNIVSINGPVFDKEKEKVLKNAYCFIQCSRFEGQPMGIIEALSIGLPCVVTYGTNVGDYISINKCGLSSGLMIDDIFNNINVIVSDEKLRNIMSNNAKNCAEKDLYWNVVINNCIQQYKNIVK